MYGIQSKLGDKEVTLIHEGKAYKLSNINNQVSRSMLPEIESDQETDTRAILYYFHAKSKGYKNVIVQSR